MENQIKDTPQQMTTIDYTNILLAIKDHIPDLNIKSTDTHVDFNNLNEVTEEIITELEAYKITNLLDISQQLPHHVTLNHKNYDEFSHNIQQINKALKTPDVEITKISTIGELQKKGHPKIHFGITYPFESKNLARREMTFLPEGQERLRIDEIEISLNLREIQETFKNNIIDRMVTVYDDEEELEYKIERIKKGEYNVKGVIEMLNNESLARIKRTASYLYMDYIVSNYVPRNQTTYRIAKNYVRRFEQLDEYLSELAMRPEDDSTVQIGLNTYNICDILSDGQVFNSLPFIGNVEGVLLEDKSPDVKTFRLALRMKLNGAVQTAGFRTSLEYQLNMIANPEESDVKRLRTFFLLMFMLVNLEDDDYEPNKMWDKYTIRIKNEGMDGFNNNVNRFVDYCNNKKIHNSMFELKKLFMFGIKTKASECDNKKYIKNLVLQQGILESDLEGPNIFKPVEYTKHYLKYVTVTNKPTQAALISVPISLTISSKSLYQQDKVSYTDLEYDLNDLKCLPIIFYPDLKIGDTIWETMANTYHIRIPYTPWTKDVVAERGALYAIVYTTLIYISIEKMLSGISSPKT